MADGTVQDKIKVLRKPAFRLAFKIHTKNKVKV